MALPKTNSRRIGTHEGELKFGHVDMNGSMSGVQLRNGPPGPEAEHYMQFVSTGKQKGGTINRCPRTYQIWCSEKSIDGIGFILNVADGDIVIRAENGDIRFEGKNIMAVAGGANGKEGYINLSADEKIILQSKNIQIDGSSVVKFFSSGLMEMVGKNALNFYGGMVDCADSCTTAPGALSKPFPSPFEIQNLLTV